MIKSGAPRPIANYSEAFTLGGLVFAAGQIASDYKSGVPAEARKHPNFPFYGSDIKLQTTYILNNLKQTFEAAGSSLDNVVKAQVFMTDLKKLRGIRRSLEGVFQSAAATHDSGDQRLAGERFASGDRFDRYPLKASMDDRDRRLMAAVIRVIGCQLPDSIKGEQQRTEFPA